MASATHQANLTAVRSQAGDWTVGLRELQRRPVSLAALAIIVITISMALGADRIVSYSPLEQDFNAILTPPSTTHWFGTDNLGRDILSRILHGARITLTIGVGTLIISTVTGTALALVAGYFGGFIDALAQRLIDAWLAFPLIIFALTVLAALGPGMWQTVAAVSVVSIPTTARVVRGSVIVEKQKMYIEAARAMGASGTRVVLNHILPNVAAPVLVIASLTMARAILTEAALSFLGLGVPAPAPAWGSMLSGASRLYMLAAPWMAIWPGIAICLAVLSWNMLGDTLRDIWDPRLRSG